MYSAYISLIIPKSDPMQQAKKIKKKNYEYANTQWALYPNGGCISNGGAVLPAWFFNRPLYPAHVDASDSEFRSIHIYHAIDDRPRHEVLWAAMLQRIYLAPYAFAS